MKSYNSSDLHKLSKDELVYLITILEEMLTDPNVPLRAGDCDFCGRCFMSTHNWREYSDERYMLCNECYTNAVDKYGPDNLPKEK